MCDPKQGHFISLNPDVLTDHLYAGVPKKIHQKGYKQLARQFSAQEIIHEGWLSSSEISITRFLILDQHTLIYNFNIQYDIFNFLNFHLAPAGKQKLESFKSISLVHSTIQAFTEHQSCEWPCRGVKSPCFLNRLMV